MKPILYNMWGVKALCPDCGATSYFDFRDGGNEYSAVLIERNHTYEGIPYGRIAYRLLRCSGCGRGGLAKIHYSSPGNPNALETFYPRGRAAAKIPDGVPAGILSEFREAELCESVGAWRAASALLRSTLEKALRANGYEKGSLYDRIEGAAKDGAITAARAQKAHDDIRVLGNDVLHDEWREVTPEEVSQALHYAQRVLEDLYDDRLTVEAVLKAKGRL